RNSRKLDRTEQRHGCQTCRVATRTAHGPLSPRRSRVPGCGGFYADCMVPRVAAGPASPELGRRPASSVPAHGPGLHVPGILVPEPEVMESDCSVSVSGTKGETPCP